MIKKSVSLAGEYLRTLIRKMDGLRAYERALLVYSRETGPFSWASIVMSNYSVELF